MKCADCPVNDGYCVFANPKQVRCPIPLLRERRIKAHNESYHGYMVTTMGSQVVTGSLLAPVQQKSYDDSNVVTFLNDDEINRIIDKALREHFKDSHEVKRLPKGYLDYALMFTEGGEANAIATAISIAQNEKTTKFLKAKYGEMFK